MRVAPQRLFAVRASGFPSHIIFARRQLPPILDYTGEFGSELVLFLPYCTWLSKAGLLKRHCIRTYHGMRCYYDDLECSGLIEKTDKRDWVRPQDRPWWLPVKDEHDFDNIGRPVLHDYPDLRHKFSRLPLVTQPDLTNKRLLVIHNKHNNEWDRGPVNHFPKITLERLFHTLCPTFTVVYIRHEMGTVPTSFSQDHNLAEPFDESDLLARHPQVLTFQSLYQSHRNHGGNQDVNTFKNVLYSRCYHFISSQGGGAHQIAMYSGSLLVILHRAGREESWAYGDGFYGFMTHVPPLRAICRTDADVVSALPLFSNTAFVGDRILIDISQSNLLLKLSPWTIAERRE